MAGGQFVDLLFLGFDLSTFSKDFFKDFLFFSKTSFLVFKLS